MSGDPIEAIWQQLNDIKIHLAKMPCQNHQEKTDEHEAILHGTPEGNDGLVTRVAQLETRTDHNSRWINAIGGAFAGLVISLASAAIVGAVLRLASDDRTDGRFDSANPITSPQEKNLESATRPDDSQAKVFHHGPLRKKEPDPC